MKAQAGYSSRGWKDCICREEKRKAAWGMQRDLETGNRKLVVLWVRLEIGLYSLFCVYCPKPEMSLKGRQKFPGKKCSLGQLSPLGTSCSPSFKFPFKFPLTAVKDRDDEVYSVTASC
jgi:hypothetical protein